MTIATDLRHGLQPAPQGPSICRRLFRWEIGGLPDIRPLGFRHHPLAVAEAAGLKLLERDQHQVTLPGGWLRRGVEELVDPLAEIAAGGGYGGRRHGHVCDDNTRQRS